MDSFIDEIREAEVKKLNDLDTAIFTNKSLEYLSERDFVNKGKDVNPSTKQWKDVNILSLAMRVTNESLVDENNNVFDVVSKQRILINKGFITMYENSRDNNKCFVRYFFLFNDILLITSKKENAEQYELQNIFWIKDIKLRYLDIDFVANKSLPETIGSSTTTSNIQKAGKEKISAKRILSMKFSSKSTPNVEVKDSSKAEESAMKSNNSYSDISNNLKFEIITNKSKSMLQSKYYFVCENESSRSQLVTDIENVILAYHKDTIGSNYGKLTQQFGWFHDLILGSIHSAAYNGDLSNLRKHLKYIQQNKLQIDILDKGSMSPLHWAVLKEQETCVRLLLAHGADPDCRNIAGNTSVLLAASTGNDVIFRVLLEYGGDINAKNIHQHTVVYMALMFGNLSKNFTWLLQLCAQHGIDFSRIDPNNGYSPLHICAEKGITRPVSILIDFGIDVNIKHGISNLTALQIACSQLQPNAEIIRSLLEKGAYPNLKDMQVQ